MAWRSISPRNLTCSLFAIVHRIYITMIPLLPDRQALPGLHLGLALPSAVERPCASPAHALPIRPSACQLHAVFRPPTPTFCSNSTTNSCSRMRSASSVDAVDELTDLTDLTDRNHHHKASHGPAQGTYTQQLYPQPLRARDLYGPPPSHG